MAAKVENLNRLFNLNGHHFSDPNPDLTPEEALAQLGAAHPELNNASLGAAKITQNNLVYEIKQNFGTKG